MPELTYHQRYYRAHKEALREKSRAWAQQHPDAAREYYRRNREHRQEHKRAIRYGMAPGTFAQMLETQGGCCAVCGTAVGTDAVVDHNHQTGRVRGLVCAACNSGLGAFQDTLTRLLDLQAYLLRGPVVSGAEAARVRAECAGPCPTKGRSTFLRQQKYGLRVETFGRLLEAQSGGCAVCRSSISGKGAHVDHDHGTGAVRGLLCARCNLGLGRFKDSLTRVRQAIQYLAREQLQCL